MHENIEKTQFYKIVLLTISMNRDIHGLEVEIGSPLWTDFLPLKHISFSSTQPSFHRIVITLSKDIYISTSRPCQFIELCFLDVFMHLELR